MREPVPTLHRECGGQGCATCEHHGEIIEWAETAPTGCDHCGADDILFRRGTELLCRGCSDLAETACEHDHYEHGRCAGCGELADLDLDEIAPHSVNVATCQGRGWYHDGSEEQAARSAARPPKPCPSCATEVA